MKKLITFSVIYVLCFSGSAVVHAQKPADQKPAQTTVTTQAAPQGVKSDDKREELSKKLLQRKDELRKEDHDRNKERRNTDAHPKSPKQ